ncbi:MAG: GNAT family N-acetyltransferase [Pseudomonas sp.]
MVFKVEASKLVGEHVVLEPIAASHVDALFEIGQEREDWAYLPIPCFFSRDDVEKWVEQALVLAERGQHFTFVHVHPASGQLMGSTRYLNIRERDHGLEIGYTWLGRAHQRTMVNTEAKYLLLRNAFESIGAHRVELKTDSRNTRSQKAIERIGAQREGVLRRHMVTQNGYVRDSVLYSITDLDWPQVKKNLESKLVR